MASGGGSFCRSNLFTHNKPLQLDRLWEIDFSNFGSQELTFQVDRIGFALEHVDPPRFKSGPSYQAKARVAADDVLHAISDAIYGVCDLPREKLSEYRIPITRWGGNPSTRYNWELGVDNAGSDWYFTNRGKPLTRLSESGYVANIDGNQVIGATTYQTVPMIGWVAKDNSSYGFSVAKYGPQKGTEPGKPDVGNGVLPAGGNVTGNDPRDTSVPAPPEFIGRAVRYVVRFAGKADGSDGKPGVKYWALDNEPMLWHATHRDVFPAALGLRRVVEADGGLRRGHPCGRPDRQGGGLLQLGLDRPLLFRQGCRQGQLPDQARLAGPRQDAAGRVVHQAMRRLQEEERQAPGRRAGRPLVSPRAGQGQGPVPRPGTQPGTERLPHCAPRATCGIPATSRNRGFTTPIVIRPWPSSPASANGSRSTTRAWKSAWASTISAAATT